MVGNIITNVGRVRTSPAPYAIRIAQATATNYVEDVTITANKIVSETLLTDTDVANAQGMMGQPINDTTGRANFVYANTCPAAAPCKTFGRVELGQIGAVGVVNRIEPTAGWALDATATPVTLAASGVINIADGTGLLVITRLDTRRTSALIVGNAAIKILDPDAAIVASTSPTIGQIGIAPNSDKGYRLINGTPRDVRLNIGGIRTSSGL